MLSKFSSIFSCWELQFRAEFMVRAPDLLLLDSVPRVELLWLNVYCISWMLGRSIWCLHDTVAWQLASQTRDVFIFPVTLGSNSILLLNCDFFLISNMNADVVKASNLRCITASIPCLCFFFQIGFVMYTHNMYTVEGLEDSKVLMNNGLQCEQLQHTPTMV